MYSVQQSPTKTQTEMTKNVKRISGLFLSFLLKWVPLQLRYNIKRNKIKMHSVPIPSGTWFTVHTLGACFGSCGLWQRLDLVWSSSPPFEGTQKNTSWLVDAQGLRSRWSAKAWRSWMTHPSCEGQQSPQPQLLHWTPHMERRLDCHLHSLSVGQVAYPSWLQLESHHEPWKAKNNCVNV